MHFPIHYTTAIPPRHDEALTVCGIQRGEVSPVLSTIDPGDVTCHRCMGDERYITARIGTEPMTEEQKEMLKEVSGSIRGLIGFIDQMEAKLNDIDTAEAELEALPWWSFMRRAALKQKLIRLYSEL